MKTTSRILVCAAAFLSLALAPAIAVADTEPSKPKDDGASCKCQRRHGSERGRGDASDAKPAANTEIPEWVRQTWTSP